MSASESVLKRWEEFWFRPVPAHVYALLRIVFGTLGCLGLAGVSDFQMFWDLDGFVALEPWLELKRFFRDQGFGNVAGRLLYAACLAAFLGMAIGYQTAIAVPLAFAAALAQLSWSYFPLSGAHSVMIGVLFCLIWPDCGAVWSVDAWLERRSGFKAPPPVSPIAPLRLIRFQVAAIYLNTGLWKLFSPSWRDGSAVHYVLNQNVFQRFSAENLPPGLDWTMTVGTYTTLVWEIAFPLLILFWPTRVFALVLGVAIHIGMLVSIDVGLFSLVMLATYVAFLEPEWVATRFTRLLRAPFYTVVQLVHPSGR